MDLEVLWEDGEVLIVYKPAGLASQSASLGQDDVESILRRRGLAAPHLVHRLDQPVEGLMAVAKTRRAAAALGGQMGQGLWEKVYLALVWGRPAEERGRWTDFWRKKSSSLAEVAPERGGGGIWKPARLEYGLLESREVEAGVQSLLEVRIFTGRMHQIRAQLASHGLPLAGDAKYGRREGGGLGLCAHRLELNHPCSGERLAFAIRPRGAVFGGWRAVAAIMPEPESGLSGRA